MEQVAFICDIHDILSSGLKFDQRRREPQVFTVPSRGRLFGSYFIISLHSDYFDLGQEVELSGDLLFLQYFGRRPGHQCRIEITVKYLAATPNHHSVAAWARK